MLVYKEVGLWEFGASRGIFSCSSSFFHLAERHFLKPPSLSAPTRKRVAPSTRRIINSPQSFSADVCCVRIGILGPFFFQKKIPIQGVSRTGENSLPARQVDESISDQLRIPSACPAKLQHCQLLCFDIRCVDKTFEFVEFFNLSTNLTAELATRRLRRAVSDVVS